MLIKTPEVVTAREHPMAALRNELQQKRDFDSPEQEAYLNLQRSAGILNGPFVRLFKEAGLSQSQYNILRILRGQDEQGLSCSAISHRMVNRDPDVTRRVDRLLAQGLVERTRSPEDRRVVLISITAGGLELLAGLDEQVKDLHREVLGHLTRDELNELNRLLVKARHPEGEEIQ
jgi:DNA-binding MarR family transcriptional regulator